jgi:acyl-CoA synthetase (AMP-forming)/AMP-acid ligase II
MTTTKERETMTTEIDSQPPIAAHEESEPAASEVVQQAAPDRVLVIHRTTLNYAVIALAFFTLGIILTLIATDRLAVANAAENQQLIAQAVAAALESRGETVGSGQQAAAVDPNARVKSAPTTIRLTDRKTLRWS